MAEIGAPFRFNVANRGAGNLIYGEVQRKTDSLFTGIEIPGGLEEPGAGLISLRSQEAQKSDLSCSGSS